ncbi:MAG: hypothetical protein J5700_04960, partial [Treponema sp.]|nr:hypothetical protein [Treponema sp.]
FYQISIIKSIAAVCQKCVNMGKKSRQIARSSRAMTFILDNSRAGELEPRGRLPPAKDCPVKPDNYNFF